MEREVELESEKRQLDRVAHDVCEKLILVPFLLCNFLSLFFPLLFLKRFFV
jgi:hypothetical protein